ncbi:hypothetical protein QTN25_004961 [Entamoeba marina]
MNAHLSNDIELNAHKIRKLHSIKCDENFKRIAKNFSILRSLKVITPLESEQFNFIQCLFILKDVITLKELVIYIKIFVNINDLIKLRKLLRNVNITLLIIN